MSYSQFTRSTNTATTTSCAGLRERQASGPNGVTRHYATVSAAAMDSEDGGTASGSFDLRSVLASKPKHTRRMGTVRQAMAPQRLNFVDHGNTPAANGRSQSLHGQQGASSGRPASVARMPQRLGLHRSQPKQTQSSIVQRPLEPIPFLKHSPSTEFDTLAEENEDSSVDSGGAGRQRSRQPTPLSKVGLSRSQSQPSPYHRPPLATTNEIASVRPPSQHQHHSSAFGVDVRQPNLTPLRLAGDAGSIQVKGQRYTVLKIIGKGGSSVVYEVYDEERNLRAIKKVDLSEASEAEAKGYANEISLLEKLQGDSRIIKMYDFEFIRDQQVLYVVMERGDIDLANLLKRMSADKPITEVQRKFYWSEMLQAVQSIHKRGVIHSDLKPANFMVVGGTLKLIDFGIASSVQSDKTSVVKDTQMGTFNFMSPEAIQDLSSPDDPEEDEYGKKKPHIKISYKSDIWSLGCILYNLTYGKMPFGHIRIPLKKLEAITDPNYKIAFPDKGHDPNLIDTIKRCLIRDPSKRASVEELLNHPYLSSDATASSGVTPGSNKHLAVDTDAATALLAKLQSAMTPNTRRGLSRAVQRLSQSDTNLAALQALELT